MADPRAPTLPATTPARGFAEALLFVAGSTLLGLALTPSWGNSAVDLLYLPAVLATAVLGGLWPALFAALLSALAYNFFFTAPHMTFRISNPNDIVTVIVLFAVAVVTSQLAASVRRQASIAQRHATRSATIAGLARRLLSCTSEQEIGEASTSELASIFHCNAVLLANLPDTHVLGSLPQGMRLLPNDLAVAALVLKTGDRAGRGVDRAVPTEWQFHPIKSGSAVIAAVALARDDGTLPVSTEQLPLLDNLLDQVALALERGRLEGEAREFTRLRERDQVRSALLATIGQDLKPRLQAIDKAVGGLRRGGSDKELVSALASEAFSLDRYLGNLLELSPASDQQPVYANDVSIDLARRIVLRDGDEVHLTPKEFAVLAELAKHPGRVLDHRHLLRTAWGPAHEKQIDYLRVAIRGLRQKLERDPTNPGLIINEPAVGYRLRAGYGVNSQQP